MTDPYLPALADFAFTEDEEAIVHAALQADAPWDYKPPTKAGKDLLKEAKKRILEFHMARHKKCCCYCRTSLAGAGPFMTDREHILPKGDALFRLLAYSPWNLTVACKRCNIQFKGKGQTFIVDTEDATQYQHSANYRFIHPNFDRWSAHLKVSGSQEDDVVIRKYRVVEGSDKGLWTYEYFALRELDVDSFDEGQGRAAPDRTEPGERVMELAEQYGQKPLVNPQQDG